MLHTFQTPSEAIKFAIANIGKTHASRAMAEQDQDFAGASLPAMLRMAEGGGDSSKVAAAAALLSKLELAFPETERAEFVPSVAGAYPCVPDFIMGMPEPMRVKAYTQNNSSPIKIGVFSSVSSGINEKQYQARAVAILAIIMQLTNTGRAVELWNVATLQGDDEKGETIVQTRLGSSPVSLSEAGMLLCNVAFSRRVPFVITTATNHPSGRIGWPDRYSMADNGAAYAATIAKELGYQMVLPSLHLQEAGEIDRDVAGWMLAKYSVIQAQIEAGA